MKPLLNTARPHRDGFCTVMCAARHKLPTTAANILNTKHLSITKNLLFYSVSPKCPQGHDLSDWGLFTNASEKAFFRYRKTDPGRELNSLHPTGVLLLVRNTFPNYLSFKSTEWLKAISFPSFRPEDVISPNFFRPEIKFVHQREHVNDVLLHPTFLTGKCFTLVPRSAFGGN